MAAQGPQGKGKQSSANREVVKGCVLVHVMLCPDFVALRGARVEASRVRI